MNKEIIVAILGSGAFFTFVQFLITRYDKKHDVKDEILKKLNYLEIGLTRVQLMVLMSDYCKRHEEVMKLAHHYFVDLKGDFCLTTLFNKWLDENDITKPSWFIEGNI